MRICELKQKEVINTCTCRSLGCPVDIEFDCKTNRLTALIVPGPGKLVVFLDMTANISFPGNVSAELVMILFLWRLKKKNVYINNHITTPAAASGGYSDML